MDGSWQAETTNLELAEGVSVACRVGGSGPAVLLVHGILGDSRVWDGVAAILAGSCRVLVPDLPGFGQSSRTRDLRWLWLDGRAEALARVLDAAQVEAAVVAGHDVGGPSAVALWGRAPKKVRALTLCACNLTADTPIPFPLSLFNVPLVGAGVAKLMLSDASLRGLFRKGFRRPPAGFDVDAWMGDAEQRAAMRACFDVAIRDCANRYAAVHALLGRLDVPTRVLWGEQDPFFSVAEGKRQAAHVPGVVFEVLPGCGHFLPAEDPAAVAERILAQAR